MKYYMIGAFLNRIWDTVNDDVDIFNRPHKNKVTGIIKGSGIAKSHIDIFGNYGTKVKERESFIKNLLEYLIFINVFKVLTLK